LPALEQVLDVDGFVKREAEKDDYYTWGVQFHQPSARAVALIDTYVEWDPSARWTRRNPSRAPAAWRSRRSAPGPASRRWNHLLE